MSQPADGYAARLGSHSDWGLTRESFAPLRDELADHLHCLADEDNPDNTTEEVARKMDTAKVRRALTSTRIPDQIYATLHRWPTREEWYELALLLTWFLLIVLSDVLAVRADSISATQNSWAAANSPITLPINDQLVFWSAWGLQAFGRAGFFTVFAYSLWRASTHGWGVVIARILQLKLIHTVLVVTAGLSIGHLLAQVNWFPDLLPYYVSNLPIWLTAPVVSGIVLLMAAPALFLKQGPFWALGFTLFALFLYPGGPVTSESTTYHIRFLRGEVYELANGQLMAVSNPGRFRINHPDEKVVAKHEISPAIIARYLVQHPQMGSTLGVNVQDNSWPARDQKFVGNFPGNIRFWKAHHNEWLVTDQDHSERLRKRALRIDEPTHRDLVGPVSAPGAGLGWLAAPIPFLGAIGLILLWALMGRRGVLNWLMYGLLAGAAMIATVTPFMVGQAENQMFNFNAVGMVYTPFPGFEALMVVPFSELISEYFAATLVLGLLLSAGVPWLLTSLFLKPTHSNPQPNSPPELAA